MLARGEGRPARFMRVPALHALVRHLRIFLSADRRRQRLHAAAGSAGHRRSGAAGLAGALHRREHGAGHATTISPGRRWFSSAACTCSGGRSTTSAAAPMPSAGSRCWAAPRCRHVRSTIRSSTICMSASWATRPTNCSRGSPTTLRGRPRQMVFTTKERRELTEFPIPAYELAQIDRYLLGSIQFSSGCPYQCEFCDIPALYGRVARYKTPEQVCAELDKLVACGLSGAVYFVDDNFIAQQARRARDAAAPDRMAEAQRLSVACCRARRRSTSPSGRKSWS